MKITVLVPTYKRTETLTSCLEGLSKQTRQPDEIIVVGNNEDIATIALMQTQRWKHLPLKTVYLNRRGQVQQLNAGIMSATGDIIAITDDDAVPRPNWLERIEEHFVQGGPQVVGVGGRDVVHHGEEIESGAKAVVGKVLWHGKVIGNHHLGVGGPRLVDVLKGANCSYRRSIVAEIGFDERLRGNGSQIHNDMSIGLRIRSRGLSLIYDPAVTVDHYPAMRFDEDQRDQFNKTALSNIAYNDAVCLLEYLPPLRRTVYLVWAFLVGTRALPGLTQFFRLLPAQRKLSWQRMIASWEGRWQAYLDWRTQSRYD
ncbi:MAG: glycosyltransferase [Candidatus Obscuribacterales bacterium]|nr:glycosyltransferase [Candidatus Obscuribacterales bacterium]